MSPEEATDLRKQVLAGQRLTVEQSAAVVAFLRGSRRTAAESAAANTASGKTRSRKKPMSDADLDADLDLFLKPKGAANAANHDAGAGNSDSAPDLDIS